MIMHNGIGEYLEDWVEQIHQRYKQSKARGKMRDLVVIANYHSRVDKLYHNDHVLKIKKDVKDKSKRNFSKPSTYFNGDERDMERKEQRRQRRRQAVIDARALFDSKPEMLSGLQRNLFEIRIDGDDIEAGMATL